VVAELKERSKKAYVSPFLLASVYVGLGDREQTLSALELAYQEHDQVVIYLKVAPDYDRFRSEPRFQKILRGLGLSNWSFPAVLTRFATVGWAYHGPSRWELFAVGDSLRSKCLIRKEPSPRMGHYGIILTSLNQKPDGTLSEARASVVLASIHWNHMPRLTRNYYQICKVDHQRNQEQMVAEVERLNEAEKLVEKYLRNMNSSQKKDEISYRVTKMLRRAS
jgi:hypothetical protein